MPKLFIFSAFGRFPRKREGPLGVFYFTQYCCSFSVLHVTADHWDKSDAFVPLWISQVLVIAQVDYILYVHILNDFCKVVLIHLIFVDDYLVCSVLKSEQKMWLALTLSEPRRWSKAWDVTSRTHFNTFQVDNSPLANLLRIFSRICCISHSNDRLGPLKVRHTGQLWDVLVVQRQVWLIYVW